MTTAVLVLARTLHLGSAMLLVALPYFTLIIVSPALLGGSTKGYDLFFRRIIKWLWAAWLLEGISGFVWFWLVTAQMNDESPWDVLNSAALGTVLWQTRFGQLWLIRAVVVIALGVVLSLQPCRKAPLAVQPSFLDWLLLIISGVLLVTLAWAGHAGSGIHYYTLHLVADALHLLIGAIWPVGLIPLFCFLWHRSDPIEPADREINILQRFSQISLFAVLIMVVTGTINGWLMVGTWENLVTTTYGRLLLGKVLIVGIMIGLGAINRLVILPRLKAEVAFFQTLRVTVLAESGLAVVVLFIVGIMGMTAPPA